MSDRPRPTPPTAAPRGVGAEDGWQRVARLLEDVVDRLDTLIELAESEESAELYCPAPDARGGIDVCPGGEKLARSRAPGAHRDQFFHPLPEAAWSRVPTAAGGESLRKNHNVYRSWAVLTPAHAPEDAAPALPATFSAAELVRRAQLRWECTPAQIWEALEVANADEALERYGTFATAARALATAWGD